MKVLNFFRKLIIRLTIVLLIVSTVSVCYAQPTDPQTDPDNPVPIHGIAYLLLGGLVIGIRKIIGYRNKKQ